VADIRLPAEFVYVQLPNLARQPEPSKSGWAEMREAQLFALSTPHTAMEASFPQQPG
jgi:sialate O-acetylesterase